MVTDFLEKVKFELVQSLKITTGSGSVHIKTGKMVRQSSTTTYLYLKLHTHTQQQNLRACYSKLHKQ